jgi:hypothetical protein
MKVKTVLNEKDGDKNNTKAAQPLNRRWKLTVQIAWFILATVGAVSLVAWMWPEPLPLGLKKEWFPKVDSLGVFGDAFGVVTSLVSLLTLLVAMRLYELQRTELEKTTEALNEQHYEAARSRAEIRINEAIEDYRAQLDAIVMYPFDISTQPKVLRGRDALFHLWSTFMGAQMKELKDHVRKYEYGPESELYTVFSPARRLYLRNAADVESAPVDPSWIALRLHDSEFVTPNGGQQDALILEYTVRCIRRVLLVHRFQIEPLVMTLCEASARIFSSEDESVKESPRSLSLSLEERVRHASRLVSQISSIEKTFLLCFCLMANGHLSTKLRKVAEDIGLFADYEGGLDVTEHALIALGKDKHGIATRVQHLELHKVHAKAFSEHGRLGNALLLDEAKQKATEMLVQRMMKHGTKEGVEMLREWLKAQKR